MALIPLTVNVEPFDIVSIVVSDTPQNLVMLHILDALMKNLGQIYINIISRYIKKFFQECFQSADVETRRKMYNLRCTWKNVLSDVLLLKMDTAINIIDDAWPVPLYFLKQNFRMDAWQNAEVRRNQILELLKLSCETVRLKSLIFIVLKSQYTTKKLARKYLNSNFC